MKSKPLQTGRNWPKVCGRLSAAAVFILAPLLAPASHAQNLQCMTTCGTRQVACTDVNILLCGPFIGAVDIQVPDPLSPGGLLTVTTIDLGLVLDDLGSGAADWRGYVSPDNSVVFPIVTSPPDPPRGPDVSGSSQNRQCSNAAPCFLTSQFFSTTVSGTDVRRQFVLEIDQIVYQDLTQIPRALVGIYSETIDNYTLGRTVVVNGTFRLERQIPVAPVSGP